MSSDACSASPRGLSAPLSALALSFPSTAPDPEGRACGGGLGLPAPAIPVFPAVSPALATCSCHLRCPSRPPASRYALPSGLSGLTALLGRAEASACVALTNRGWRVPAASGGKVAPRCAAVPTPPGNAAPDPTWAACPRCAGEH